MGRRTAGLIVLAVLTLGALPDDGRDATVSTRPAPVTQPTSAYDGRRPPEPDRRPVEQNPTCWIQDTGWPRCREWNERTDTR